MKQDTKKTKVLFLHEWDNIGEKIKNWKPQIFAYFPEEIANDFILLGKKHVNFMCYAHIGQHSSCSPYYASDCKKATIDEYKDLMQELESVGYNLEILN